MIINSPKKCPSVAKLVEGSGSRIPTQTTETTNGGSVDNHMTTPSLDTF